MNDRERSIASYFLPEGSHLAQAHAVIDSLSGIGASAAKADDDQAEFTSIDCGHGAALVRSGLQHDRAKREVERGPFEKISGASQRADHSGEPFGGLA